MPEKEVSGNEELFEIGQVDIFQVEAVSLDELTSVTLGHNESAKGQCLAIIHFLIYLFTIGEAVINFNFAHPSCFCYFFSLIINVFSPELI